MNSEIDLPPLPSTSLKRLTSTAFLPNAGIMKQDQFTRKKLKTVLHVITQVLKSKGTRTPHIFLPFRSKIKDEKLEQFLNLLCPNGKLITNETTLQQICSTIDEFTLVSALKFFWSRLPNNEIIGYDVYLEFKRKEVELGCPKNGFLSIMPKCLSSSSHASIVYDFLDLLVNIISNSQFNYLSGRKISKMASFYAFNSMKKDMSFYDATLEHEFNFMEGISMWEKQTSALFHLVLSFLRSMLPESDQETVKIPKTLQSLLVTTSYPPNETSENIQNLITIPCVCIKTTRPSKNPFELISKVRHSLTFTDKNSFLSIENYTILKNLFSQKATSDIINSLTEESRRILTRITADPIENSNFFLKPGWCECQYETDDDIPLFSHIEIKNVSIHDYYIWTWLTSLSSDQPNVKKNLFGRSIVVEADILGFQKWIVLTEKTMRSEEYIHHFELDRREDQENVESQKHSEKVEMIQTGEHLKTPKNDKELPAIRNVQKMLDDEVEEKELPAPPSSSTVVEDDKSFDDMSFIYPTSVNTEDFKDYENYVNSTTLNEIENMTSRFSKSSIHEEIIPSTKQNTRKAPPMMDTTNLKPKPIEKDGLRSMPVVKYTEPFESYESILEKKNQMLGAEPFDNYQIPFENKFSSDNVQSKVLNQSKSQVEPEEFQEVIEKHQEGDKQSNKSQLDTQVIQDDTDRNPSIQIENNINEEKRKKRKEKRKLEKQAQAAQLAAAQAAGFPFPFLSNGMPPPPPPDPNVLSSVSIETNGNVVSPFIMPEGTETVTTSTSSPIKKKKSPKKTKRAPIDESKPLPTPKMEENNYTETANYNSQDGNTVPEFDHHDSLEKFHQPMTKLVSPHFTNHEENVTSQQEPLLQNNVIPSQEHLKSPTPQPKNSQPLIQSKTDPPRAKSHSPTHYQSNELVHNVYHPQQRTNLNDQMMYQQQPQTSMPQLNQPIKQQFSHQPSNSNLSPNYIPMHISSPNLPMQQQHSSSSPMYQQPMQQHSPQFSMYQQPMQQHSPQFSIYQQPMQQHSPQVQMQQQPMQQHSPQFQMQQQPMHQHMMMSPQNVSQMQMQQPFSMSPQMNQNMFYHPQQPQMQMPMYGMSKPMKNQELPSASNNAMMNMVPRGTKHNKNKTANKANLRNEFLQGNYGI